MTFAFEYLLDENVTSAVAQLLILHYPDLPFRCIGDSGAPSKGTADPDVLRWCEEHNSILVTNNRTSMPEHLSDHLAKARHVEGIFHIPSTMTVVELGEHLYEVAAASFAGEYRDMIHYLPIL